jgi:hypothetical protein
VARDDDRDAGRRRERRGLDLAQVAPEALGLAHRVAAVDRQDRHVRRERAQRVVEAGPPDRVAGVEHPPLRDLDEVAQAAVVAPLVAPEAVAAERVGMELVGRAQGGDAHARRLERDAVVGGVDAGARDARRLHQADRGSGREEDRAGQVGGDRGEGRRVEVVGVLVRDADEVGSGDILRAERRAGVAGDTLGLLQRRGQPRVDEHDRVVAGAQLVARLSPRGDGQLSGHRSG